MKSVNIVYLLCSAIVIAGCSFVKKQDARQQTALERELAGEMVSIPAGTFRMGDLSGEGGDNEKPVHSVTVPAFNLGRHEVTVGQFRDFVDATRYITDAERDAGGEAGCFSRRSPDENWDWVSGRRWRNPGYSVQEDQPVVCVSWSDAQAFIKWLNNKAGGNYRLPTEAEWEYAARAGSTTKYTWGDEIGSNRANCDGCDSEWDKWDDGEAAPVGNFQANAWGLQDMHGNVWEWVQDCWNDNYNGAPTDGSAWTSGDCYGRVVRGGAWDITARFLRSAHRNWNARSSRLNNLGFRLAHDE